jgi:hypothetical protein
MRVRGREEEGRRREEETSLGEEIKGDLVPPRRQKKTRVRERESSCVCLRAGLP